MQSRITKLAAAAVLLLAVLLLARHLTGRERPEGPGERNAPIVKGSDNPAVPAPILAVVEQESARLARELDSARTLFAAGDAKGLLDLLDTGLDQTKIAVAGYLGQMKEESAVPALQWLADRWQGPADDNPFRKSIEQIRAAAPENGEAIPGNQPQNQAQPSGVSAAIDDSRIVVQVTQKATGRPIPQAKIEVYMGSVPRTYAADDDGVFVLDLGADVSDFVLISVSQKGYVKRGITFRGLSREMLPKTVQLALEEGVTIGGVVQDNRGRPVEGATIEADFCEQKPSDEPWSAVRIEEKTDAQGRWRAANVPQKLDSLGFWVSHPDFADSTFAMPAQLRMDDLRAGRAVMALEKGLAITGRVTDVAGAPVAGARVLLGDIHYRPNWTQTDALGQFEFDHLNLHVIAPLPMLTVQAPRFAPQRHELSRDESSTSVEFVLKPAKLLLGRVVDSAGKPVEDARISSGNWNGYSTLQWESRTDAKGMFLWDSAPDDAVVIRIAKAGYREIERPVIADSRERTFVLGRPTTIQGAVVDAHTREPVKRFRVWPGIQWQEGNMLSPWQSADSWGKWFTDGRYSFTFNGDGRAYAVRVEADGYLPFESRFVDANEAEATIDAVLTRGQGPSGYVFDANGAPVAGVDVFWQGTQGRPTRLEKNWAGVVYATTDGQGHFTFKPEKRRDPFSVFCDQGTATVAYEDLVRDGSITLTPWARVQGYLYAGTKPVVNKRLSLGYSLSAMLGTASVTSTDENGRFVFDRVYPGEFTLLDKKYRVWPGQTLELHFGGTGRTVKGELAMPEAPDIPIQIDLILLPRIDRFMEGFPWPAGQEQMSFSELREWRTQFLRSPEGQAYLARREEETSKVYHFELDGDRTFHADNVEPGTYILLGEIHLQEWSKVIGRVWHKFEVPPFTKVADLDVSLDLGSLAVVYGELEPGDPAPDFDVPASGSGRVRLADYRDKVLLVSLFDMGSMDPNSQDLLALKAVHRRFSGNPRYAQISLQLAWIALLDKKAVEEAHLEWPHGLIDECKDRVSTDYRLRLKDKPWNVLIGPQGQILAVGLSGEDLTRAIEDELQAAR
ncbi:MAG: hypothetical protein ABFE01_20235 [Phycisphaerales bacterium]